MTSLDLLIALSSIQELQLVLVFVGYVLEVVRSADPRGGLCCGRYTVAGYAGRPFGVSGPCSHRSGPYVETSAGLPEDGTWIGNKPGLKT